MPLTISLTPGALPVDGDVITNAVLRQIAQPAIALEGSIGSASISTGAVDTAQLANGALSADNTGRTKMEDGYVTADKLAADAVETLKIKDANVTNGKLALNVFSGTTAKTVPVAADSVVLVDSADSSKTKLVTRANFMEPVQVLAKAVAPATVAVSKGIPLDNTIPQSDEGGELVRLAITKLKADTALRVRFSAQIYVGGGNEVAMSLVKVPAAGVVDAVAAAYLYTNGNSNTAVIDYFGTGLAAGAHTFAINVGNASTTSVTVNAALGAMPSFLVIEEITATVS